mmetsp:Transcript_60057/g.107164  ORF Transcript_60057/g.107164 Transcript_60057/m.107164 type:complete len:85 (-) Transcript_60057:110-364(-)
MPHAFCQSPTLNANQSPKPSHEWFSQRQSHNRKYTEPRQNLTLNPNTSLSWSRCQYIQSPRRKHIEARQTKPGVILQRLCRFPG